MKIFDAFTFFNELDLLELRLEILGPHVDTFILVESHQTFSGMPKPLYYEENKERFAKWNDKIIHIVVPNIEVTDGNLFKRHYLCYEAIEQRLMDIYAEEKNENAWVFCSDLDEIWNPGIINYRDLRPHSLIQNNYSYWLNFRSNEEWTGSIMAHMSNVFIGFNQKYRTEKPNCIHRPEYSSGGWHFSNMGGPEQIIKKLEAYDHSNEVLPMLSQFEGYGIKDRMDKGYDFLGRAFNYQGVPFAFHIEADENLPRYLIDNKNKWVHMLK